MNSRGKLFARFLMAAAVVVGGSSLALFGVFLFRGPFRFVDCGVPLFAALGIDIALCLLFFFQHSVMVRKSYQEWVRPVVPPYYHRAVYSVASGVALLALVVFWQPTSEVFSVQGIARWILRGAFAGGVVGFVWGVKALGSFDAFGTGPIKAHLRNSEPSSPKFAVKGPYRLVRHPLYTFMLLLFWSYPEVSPDRLLLNTAFTIWVVVGAVLEERDLVSEFDEAYIEYQRSVPMLLPWRIPKAGRWSHPTVRGSGDQSAKSLPNE